MPLVAGVGDLVGGDLQRLDPPGLQVPFAPDLGDCGIADAKFLGKQPRSRASTST